MNENVRKMLHQLVKDEEKASKIDLNPFDEKKLVLKLEDSLLNTLRRNILTRPESVLDAGCTTFSCPGSFGCDWF